MLYLGSLLHEDVKLVAYFKHWGFFGEFCTFIGNINDLQGSIVFLINGDARLQFGLLKYYIFREISQSVFSNPELEEGVEEVAAPQVFTTKYSLFLLQIHCNDIVLKDGKGYKPIQHPYDDYSKGIDLRSVIQNISLIFHVLS